MCAAHGPRISSGALAANIGALHFLEFLKLVMIGAKCLSSRFQTA